MPVEGPLAFRYNIWKDKEIQSPSWEMKWAGNGVIHADCKYCEKNDHKRLISKSSCRCGIYATLNQGILRMYDRGKSSALFLVEGVETVHLYTQGFRAAAVQVVAVIGGDKGHKLAAVAAADTFDIPIITLLNARRMAKIQWEKYGMKWEPNVTSI